MYIQGALADQRRCTNYNVPYESSFINWAIVLSREIHVRFSPSTREKLGHTTRKILAKYWKCHFLLS